MEKTCRCGVKQAPTLVSIKDGEYEVINNLSNIKKYVNEMEKVKC